MPATGQPIYKAGPGTSLKYGAVGSSPSTALTPIRAFSGMPSFKAKTFDTTQIDAVDGAGAPDMYNYKGFGKIMPGQMKVRIASGVADATYIAAKAIMAIAKQWLLTYSNGATDSMVGAICEISPTFVGEDEEVLFDITIEMSGPSVFTAGT